MTRTLKETVGLLGKSI